jgi:multiple sugar transport system substrate-binding protein
LLKALSKNVLISFYLIGMLLVCIGCGSYSFKLIDRNVKQEQQNNAKEKLKFWMRAPGKSGVNGKLVEKYNRDNNDNVIIEFEVFGENYKNAVTMALAAGDPPDVFELNAGLNIQQLAEAGQIIPLDQFIDDEIKGDIYPEVFEQKQFYYKGKMYAVPERMAFFRLMYNKNIFKNVGIDGPPETLEQLIDYAVRITEFGRGEFYGYGAAMKTNSSSSRFTDNICSISGLTGEAGFDWSTGQFDFMKQKQALQLLIKMKEQKVLYPGYLNLDIDVARVRFAQGKIGMMIDGNWMVGIYGNNEIKCNIDWDSAPIPVFSGNKRGKSYISFDMAKMISASTKIPEKAWNFIRYNFENQEQFVMSGEPLRTSIKANMKENIPLQYKGAAGFTDIENSKPFPLQAHSFLTRLEGEKYEKVYQQIVAGEIDIDNGLKDLSKRYNAALDKAIAEGLLAEEDIRIQDFDYFNYYNITN